MPELLEQMGQMFEPKLFEGSKSPKSGKYSFSEKRRTQIFKFAIDEIRKYSNCKIALCKESGRVWNDTGFELDYADMS